MMHETTAARLSGRRQLKLAWGRFAQRVLR
jgi:hypothetical protein